MSGGLHLTPHCADVFVPLLKPSPFKGAHGGRGSGKTHFFGEMGVLEAASQHIRMACLREFQNSIKESVKQVLEQKIIKFGLSHLFKITDNEIRGPFDSLFVFKGMQNHTAESFKSYEGFNRGWIAEGQTISQRSLDIVIPTFREENSQLWCDWNPRSRKDPVDKFFRHEDSKRDPDIVCVEANYRDNPWFPDKLRKDMLRDRRRDPDKYAHIWLGQYENKSQAAVFRNWKIGKREVPKGARPYYGADWGFSVDPAVLVEIFIWGNTLYIARELYRVGLEIVHTPLFFGGTQNPKLRKLNQFALPYAEEHGFEGMPGCHLWPMIADSARPETISHMKKHGFEKIIKARKGARSVEEGVEFLKNYDIVIHPSCEHTIDEYSTYAYEVDRQTEEVLPKLADRNNNVIDASRYAVENVRRALAKEDPLIGISQMAEGNSISAARASGSSSHQRIG